MGIELAMRFAVTATDRYLNIFQAFVEPGALTDRRPLALRVCRASPPVRAYWTR